MLSRQKPDPLVCVLQHNVASPCPAKVTSHSLLMPTCSAKVRLACCFCLASGHMPAVPAPSCTSLRYTHLYSEAERMQRGAGRPGGGGLTQSGRGRAGGRGQARGRGLRRAAVKRPLWPLQRSLPDKGQSPAVGALGPGAASARGQVQAAGALGTHEGSGRRRRGASRRLSREG